MAYICLRLFGLAMMSTSATYPPRVVINKLVDGRFSLRSGLFLHTLLLWQPSLLVNSLFPFISSAETSMA